jgi:uncharacterized protein with FMN-binding domain
MKRVALATVSTVAALVLMLSYKTHSPSAVATPPAAVSTTTHTTHATHPTPNKSAASKSKTYAGSAASTRYGPVQVQITVAHGKVTRAEAVVYPTQGPRDQQISSYAIPELNAEAVAASSAGVDMISGATFTSEGYRTSLQSALDQAGL